ncbi:type I-F CRISPR-associated protein Csy2 [Catenovulum adriaticum]|uniref:Type I-F CRISPR-associated protein Csy2 n=1 Tax=Catenovulum adriaticum TaxID=2984846 RepID=A0ABY7ARZ0_9ALTE|nr:type I-F CRISPR-associated protein Csy2 [Catenovulum sp. TS8]WAJ71260.1 type I-F CRISPR-associated protein Csy2 [Catenovulum sp. TS8]
MNNIKRLLLLPHIKVHNANALSSPFTIGFPAMTAWLGAVHALQRKLNTQGCSDIQFNSVAVISHQFELQTYKGAEDNVNSIIIAKRPSFTKKELTKFNSGKAPTFIEEARCHLDVSLVLEYTGIEKDDESEVREKIAHLLNSNMKMAGGDILTFKAPQFFKVENGNTTDLNALTRKLMPGYALIERRDLMTEAMAAGQDAMDALLDNLVIHHHCEKVADEMNEEKVVWTSKRKNNKGWIVPIATGFHGLTELGEAKNQRDPNTPHRFAESVVTLGEFKMPHSIKLIDEILWRYQTDQTNNLYLCAQTQKNIQTEQEIENAYYA